MTSVPEKAEALLELMCVLCFGDPVSGLSSYKAKIFLNLDQTKNRVNIQLISIKSH